MFTYFTSLIPAYSALFYYQEFLTEQNIPKVLINASQKLRIVRHQLLQKIQPLLTNRESLFQKCQPISYSLAEKLLLASYKLHSAFGCWDPIKVVIINGYCVFFNMCRIRPKFLPIKKNLRCNVNCLFCTDVNQLNSCQIFNTVYCNIMFSPHTSHFYSSTKSES